jgi:GxxExxY protein
MQDHTWQDRQDKPPHYEVTKLILKCCFEVMNTLGIGFLESIYKNALLLAMIDNGLKVTTDRGYEVVFHGRKIGMFVPDLIVEDAVIIELKAVEHLLAEHQAQLINYLAVTGMQVGLLINFGKRKLEYKRMHHPAHPAACDPANPVPF